MATARRPGEGQEEFFVAVDPQDVVVASHALPEVADSVFVDGAERARYLTDVLKKFDQLPDRDAWIREAKNPRTQLHAEVYNGGPQQGYQIIQDRVEARTKLHSKALESFKRAYGMYSAIDAKVIDPEDAEKATLGAFAEFEGTYMGATQTRFDKREAYRTRLKSVIDAAKQAGETRDMYTLVSQYNRDHGLRPHQATPLEVAPGTTPAEKRELELLTSQQRVRGIADDLRVLGVVTHNLQKNTFLTRLDYYDNPEYELGINNQLFEVLARQQKLEALNYKDGVRAVESLAWETGDFLADAAKGYRLMSELKEALAGISPRVTMAEEFGADLPAFAYLVRYKTALQFMKTGDKSGLRDPIGSTEDRWIKPERGDTSPGKHKTVHSQFTAPKRSKAVDAYLEQQAEAMTVREANRLIGSAINNELALARFSLRCLMDMRDMPEYRAMEQIHVAVSESFKAVAEEPVVAKLREELKTDAD